MKTDYEEIEQNFGLILDVMPSAELFAIAWKSYLEDNGWTEEEFENEFYQRCLAEIDN